MSCSCSMQNSWICTFSKLLAFDLDMPVFWRPYPWLETDCQQTPSHQRRPAPTAMHTQPLSKCMLIVCAYQRTRQRNIGIAKKSYQGFWWLVGKGRMFGRPFFKTNPQELSTLCIYPENSWTTQRMCQSTKHCLSQLLPKYVLSCNLGQLRRNIPWTTMTSIELRLLNTCCITQKVRCWGGNNQKDIAKEQGHGRKTYKVFSLNPFLLIWGR